MTTRLSALRLVAAIVSLAATQVGAADWVVLGPSHETSIRPSTRDDCTGGPLQANHDFTFETAYGWDYWGAWPEPNGAFGEAFDLGAGTIVCGAYWLTYYPALEVGTANLYVWEGGISGPPGAVVALVTDVAFDNIPLWPEVGENAVAIDHAVDGEFTIGYWPDWGPYPGEPGFFCAADESGPKGHPWTYVAPGIGLPSGWQDPDVAFGDCRSLGIGLYFHEGLTPARGPTWGAVKSLFATR